MQLRHPVPGQQPQPEEERDPRVADVVGELVDGVDVRLLQHVRRVDPAGQPGVEPQRDHPPQPWVEAGHLGNSSQSRATGTNGPSAAGFPLVNTWLVQNTGTGSLSVTALTALTNAGTIRQTTAGTLNLGSATGTVTNQAAGLVDVQAGTANFNGSFLNAGTVRVAAGATVNLAGSYTSSLLGRFDRGGALPVAGSNGTVRLTGGSTVGLTLDGALDRHTSTGPLLLNNGTVFGNGHTLTTSGGSQLVATNAPGTGTFNYLNNVVIGPGAFDLSAASGKLLLTGGTTFQTGPVLTTGPSFDLRVDQPQGVGSLNLTLGNGAALRAGGANGMLVQGAVRYAGTTTATIGSLSAAWPVTNQGVIKNESSGTFALNPPSTFTNNLLVWNAGPGLTLLNPRR